MALHPEVPRLTRFTPPGVFLYVPYVRYATLYITSLLYESSQSRQAVRPTMKEMSTVLPNISATLRWIR